jgi:hypothetical protein
MARCRTTWDSLAPLTLRHPLLRRDSNEPLKQISTAVRFYHRPRSPLLLDRLSGTLDNTAPSGVEQQDAHVSTPTGQPSIRSSARILAPASARPATRGKRR